MAQSFGQADALHQFHDHEELVFHADRGVERGDIGMNQAGVDLDLAAEALRQVGRLAQIRQQYRCV